MVEPNRIPAFCTQCRSRCGCVAVVAEGRLLEIEPLPGHPTGEKLCPKGRAATELVYHADRLTQPLRRTAPKGAAEPGWRPISWDEALGEIAARMASIRDLHGPEQVAFSVTTPSGTHIADSIAWIERFVRAYGSPNTIYGTEICNWHKDYAARFTYGHDIGTPDFANTDCVVLWGNNPSTTWLARNVEIMKGLKRGAKLVVIDPRPTAFAKRADQWLRVRPGTDQVVALGLANLLLSNGRFDQSFAAKWTNASLLVRADNGRFLRQSEVEAGGRDDVMYSWAMARKRLLKFDSARGQWIDNATSLELRWHGEIETLIGPVICNTALELFARAAAAYPPERVAELSGIAPGDLANAAEIIGTADKAAYYAWNGVGQSVTATQTDRAISILYALTGSYGSAGGNVPGGAAPFVDISGQDLLSAEQRGKALGLAERPIGPGLHGWVTARDVYRAVLDHSPYPVRMLVSFGTNLLVSQPDTVIARQALAALEFHVHSDFFVNATAREADILLPAATSWEREGLRTGFDASLEGLRTCSCGHRSSRRSAMRDRIPTSSWDWRSGWGFMTRCSGLMPIRATMPFWQKPGSPSRLCARCLAAGKSRAMSHSMHIPWRSTACHAASRRRHGKSKSTRSDCSMPAIGRSLPSNRVISCQCSQAFPCSWAAPNRLPSVTASIAISSRCDD